MKTVLIYLGLIVMSVLITSIGITMGWSQSTIILTNLSASAILAYIKGKYFYD